MKSIITFILGLISISVSGQNTFKINFSEKYIAKLNIEKGYEDEVFKRGNISILDAKTNEILTSIDADELTFDLNEDGQVKTNVLELPYGEQSIIIYEDFNFDGQKDLAVMDGQFSCYHGPSFQIYLETGNGLKHSPEFTELAQNYCGMFHVDYENKTIQTMTKSGCCWHQFSTFTVEDGVPIEEHVVERGLNPNGILLDYVEQNRVNNQMVETAYSMLRDDADVILVCGMTFKNGKSMEIYRAFAYEDYLFYIFKDKTDKIELFYSDQFVYDKNKLTLTFKNKNVVYQVYDKGIVVNMPNKKIDLKAVKINDNTSLSDINLLKLNNLEIK